MQPFGFDPHLEKKCRCGRGAVAQARRQKFVTWPDKVAPLLRRAAACGLARAVHELGIMYEAGDEGPKDGKGYRGGKGYGGK